MVVIFSQLKLLVTKYVKTFSYCALNLPPTSYDLTPGDFLKCQVHVDKLTIAWRRNNLHIYKNEKHISLFNHIDWSFEIITIISFFGLSVPPLRSCAISRLNY